MPRLIPRSLLKPNVRCAQATLESLQGKRLKAVMGGSFQNRHIVVVPHNVRGNREVTSAALRTLCESAASKAVERRGGGQVKYEITRDFTSGTAEHPKPNWAIKFTLKK